jgi:hypothetical protein
MKRREKTWRLARRSKNWASSIERIRLDFLCRSDVGGTTMSLARPIHLVMVCAAFAFVGAIVFGAI